MAGRNGAGKSNVLYAVERCLFWTIQGKKRDMQALKYGEDNVSVSFNWYARSKESWSWFIDNTYRPIMFCSVLDMDPATAKQIIGDIIIQEDAKKVLGKYWMWSLDKSKKHIQKEYREYSKALKSMQEKLVVYQEELDELWDINEDLLKEWKDKVDEYKIALEKIPWWVDKDKLQEHMDTVENLEDKRNKYQKEIDGLHADIKSRLKKIDEIVQAGKKANTGTCPTCGNILSKSQSSVINKYKEEYKELVAENAVDENRIEKWQISIEWLEKEIQKEKELIKKVTENDTSEKRNEIEKNLVAAREMVTKIETRMETKKEYREKINTIAEKISKETNNKLVDAYEAVGTTGKINQILNEKIKNIIPWFEISIASENETSGEIKSEFVVKTLHDGNEVTYPNLSRSQKFMANLLLSNALLEYIDIEWLILLIDDFEMFDDEHGKELLKKLSCEYIITKVSNSDLKITMKK